MFLGFVFKSRIILLVLLWFFNLAFRAIKCLAGVFPEVSGETIRNKSISYSLVITIC